MGFSMGEMVPRVGSTIPNPVSSVDLGALVLGEYSLMDNL